MLFHKMAEPNVPIPFRVCFSDPELAQGVKSSLGLGLRLLQALFTKLPTQALRCGVTEIQRKAVMRKL